MLVECFCLLFWLSLSLSLSLPSHFPQFIFYYPAYIFPSFWLSPSLSWFSMIILTPPHPPPKHPLPSKNNPHTHTHTHPKARTWSAMTVQRSVHILCLRPSMTSCGRTRLLRTGNGGLLHLSSLTTGRSRSRRRGRRRSTWLSRSS